MKAKKKELLSIAAPVPPEAAVRTVRMGLPEKKGGGIFLEGDPAAIAERLIKILKEKAGIPA
jgi:electron transfer flavoprotein beta subunit